MKAKPIFIQLSATVAWSLPLRLPGAALRLSCALAVLSALCASAQVKDYRDLKYPALPDFKIPRPTVFALSNGLQVFLMEDHELPLIGVSARIRTGANYEPAEKAGLASLVGAVQRSGGTQRQTGDQIDDFLAARAGVCPGQTGRGQSD